MVGRFKVFEAGSSFEHRWFLCMFGIWACEDVCLHKQSFSGR